MGTDHTELRNIVEAALLAAETPLTIRRLMSLFPEDASPTKAELEGVIQQLKDDCSGRGVELRKIGKGYRFQSKQRYAQWLRKLDDSRPARFSRALLETMAIIAYRQPVTRGDIEEIRGVAVSTDIMRTLLNREWISQVGSRDVPGRPALFGTTQEFLEFFDLTDLKQLPQLMERRDPAEIAQELNLRLPLEISPADSDGAEMDEEQDGQLDEDEEGHPPAQMLAQPPDSQDNSE